MGTASPVLFFPRCMQGNAWAKCELSEGRVRAGV